MSSVTNVSLLTWRSIALLTRMVWPRVEVPGRRPHLHVCTELVAVDADFSRSPLLRRPCSHARRIRLASIWTPRAMAGERSRDRKSLEEDEEMSEEMDVKMSRHRRQEPVDRWS